MIPDLLSAGARRNVWRRWVVFLALAPLAAATGFYIEQRAASGLQGKHLLNRDRAIQIGREYARKLGGFDVTDWRESCGIDSATGRLLYVVARKNAVANLIQVEVEPWGVANVVFHNSALKQTVRIRMTVDGRLLGFQIPPPAKPDNATESESLAAATAILASDPVFSTRLKTGKPEVKVQKSQTNGGEIRTYTWHGELEGNRDVDFRLTVRVQGRQVLGRDLKAEVASPLESRLEHESGLWGSKILGVAYSIFLLIVVLYALYRYVRRSIEKEIPHSRSIVVAAIIALVLGIQLFNMRDQMSVQVGGENVEGNLAIMVVIMMCVVVGLGGALAGLAYGAGEGDVREGNPGKLASLDALIVGKVFSSNVGRSILIGAGCAGWLYLVEQFIESLLPTSFWKDTMGVTVLFYRVPAFLFIAGQPLSAILATVAGLFQPLAFARLNIRRPALRWIFLSICASFAAVLGTSGSRGLSETLVAMLVGAVALLLPFYLFDVLAAVAAVVTLHSLSMLALFWKLSLDWRETAITIALLGAATLAMATLAAIRGRRYREDQVRPLYARQIAERVALEAEVSAAREAQLRLLPRETPRVPGMNIAASCIPAQEVGGDFFDFFRLGPNQLGIFVAEGSGSGLASAMTIGLAKGYLMHAVTRSHSPSEILTRLERALGSLLHSQLVRANVAFAVIDSASGRLQYARTGDYPRVIVVSRGHPVKPSLEAVMASATRSIPLVEGEIDLEPGFSVFLFTDGIVKRLARMGKKEPGDYLAQFDQDPRRPAEAVHSALFEKLLPRRRSREDLEDDLTAVIVRLSTRERESIGVVA